MRCHLRRNVLHLPFCKQANPDALSRHNFLSLLHAFARLVPPPQAIAKPPTAPGPATPAVPWIEGVKDGRPYWYVDPRVSCPCKSRVAFFVHVHLTEGLAVSTNLQC